jgi:hypothetical protein
MISAHNGVKGYIVFAVVIIVIQQFAGMSRGIDYACVTAAREEDDSFICCMSGVSAL